MKKYRNTDDIVSKYIRQHDELTEEIVKLGRKGAFYEEPEGQEQWNMIFDAAEDGGFTSDKVKNNNAEILRLCRKRKRLEKRIKKETGYAVSGEY